MKASRRRMVPVVACLVVAGVATAVALGEAGFGFVPTNLVAKADFNDTAKLNSDRVKFQTKDPTDIRFQSVTYAPGGRSGWHHHPGFVLATVSSGELTMWDAQCNQKKYGPNSPDGAVFLEYGDDPLQVGNTTDAPATLYAVYVAPNSDPPVFRIEDTPRSCP